jgi:hypothetical protein
MPYEERVKYPDPYRFAFAQKCSPDSSINPKMRAEQPGGRLPGVAGSDTYDIEELWTVYAEIETPLNVDEIENAKRRGSVKASSHSKSIHF